mmetsp:Transcript_24076/g.26723  ORF Transcript_24076/g.26723 Transcript_24076/m.26723 type:complete len:178 (-) Transcript_24076:224-757(-)
MRQPIKQPVRQSSIPILRVGTAQQRAMLDITRIPFFKSTTNVVAGLHVIFGFLLLMVPYLATTGNFTCGKSCQCANPLVRLLGVNYLFIGFMALACGAAKGSERIRVLFAFLSGSLIIQALHFYHTYIGVYEESFVINIVSKTFQPTIIVLSLFALMQEVQRRLGKTRTKRLETKVD